MNIPYETLVLIAASGGAIIIFGIAVAVICICRHVGRSRKAVIHILATSPPTAEDAGAETDNQFWERNQLIPTAHILHSFNPKAKIQAIRPTPAPNSHLNNAPVLEEEEHLEKHFEDKQLNNEKKLANLKEQEIKITPQNLVNVLPPISVHNHNKLTGDRVPNPFFDEGSSFPLLTSSRIDISKLEQDELSASTTLLFGSTYPILTNSSNIRKTNFKPYQFDSSSYPLLTSSRNDINKLDNDILTTNSASTAPIYNNSLTNPPNNYHETNKLPHLDDSSLVTTSKNDISQSGHHDILLTNGTSNGPIDDCLLTNSPNIYHKTYKLPHVDDSSLVTTSKNDISQSGHLDILLTNCANGPIEDCSLNNYHKTNHNLPHLEELTTSKNDIRKLNHHDILPINCTSHGPIDDCSVNNNHETNHNSPHLEELTTSKNDISKSGHHDILLKTSTSNEPTDSSPHVDDSSCLMTSKNDISKSCHQVKLTTTCTSRAPICDSSITNSSNHRIPHVQDSSVLSSKNDISNTCYQNILPTNCALSNTFSSSSNHNRKSVSDITSDSHLPSSSKDIKSGAIRKNNTVIHLRLQPCRSSKQCSIQSDYNKVSQSRSFSIPNNSDHRANPNLLRVQSFQDGRIPPSTSSKGTTVYTEEITVESQDLSLPSTSQSRHRTNHRSSSVQPHSQNKDSNLQQPHKQRSRTRPSQNATTTRRPQRSQSFQEQVNPNLNSQRRQSSDIVQNHTQTRREGETRQSYRQEVRRTRNRTLVRTRSMLSATQMQHLRTQVLDQPGSSLNRNFVCSSAEDVYVLDGSEPPPPYQS